MDWAFDDESFELIHQTAYRFLSLQQHLLAHICYKSLQKILFF